ncbi:MAG: uncharacterized membrane-anchored protein YhcB (DUF1043 family) [Parvicella sp.]|jgi:uncharacterized membrane-anchored protein YhcB (DUF1043 family)
MIRLFLIKFSILLPLLVCGQKEYSARIIDNFNGLPSNTIYDVIQASDGSIIIGHEKGLSRFNGVKFTHYDSEKIESLGNIIELELGKYLFRSFNDDCYITEGNRLVRVEDLSVKDYFFSTYYKLENQSVIKVHGKNIDKVWDSKKFVNENLWSCDSLNLNVSCIAEKNGEIAGCVGEGIVLYDLKDKSKVAFFNIESGPKTVCHSFMNDFFILGTTIAKGWKLTENKIIVPQQLEGFNAGDKFACMATFQDTILAIGTFGGLYLYDQNYKLISKTFEGTLITCMTEDSEGNLWLGTQLDGLKIVPSLKLTTLFEKTFKELNFSVSNSIVFHDSIIVAGSYDGRILFLSDNGSLISEIDLGRKSEVQAIYYAEGRGTLFVDCLSLFEIDLNSMEIVSKIESRSVKDMIIDANGVTHLATSVGLHVAKEKYLILEEETWFKRIVPMEDKMLVEAIDGLNAFRNDSIFPLYEDFIGGDKSKNLIVSGLNQSAGRVTFAVGSKVFEIENDIPKFLFEIPNFKIKQTIASNSNLWVTDGQVIYNYSQNGIARIDDTKGLYIYDIKKLLVLKGKLLVVGSQKTQLFEQNVATNNLAPTLRFQMKDGTFELSNSVLTSSFADNFMALDFEVLPNISSLGTCKIEYKIDGVVPNWSEISNSELLLERLPSGKYIIEVMASNEDGVISNKLYISISIIPPFYFTWWFTLLVIVFIIIVIFTIVKLRLKSVHKKNKIRMQTIRLESKAIKAELKALRAQMNPHFIFNSLSSIQSRILSGETKNAYEHLSTFSLLLRQSLKFTSKEFITLEDELAFLKNYITLEHSRTNGGFNFEFIISPNIDLKSIMFPSLLSQPFAENAIRHGLLHNKSEKVLKIRIEGGNKRFAFIIEDNGVGRVKSQEHKLQSNTEHESFALNAICERIDMINKEKGINISLHIEDLKQGTKVIISIENQDGR